MPKAFAISRLKFGRRHAVDSRDKQYPAAKVLRGLVPSLQRRLWWPSGWWGDQGDSYQCVAYAALHLYHDGPITHRGFRPVIEPTDVYKAAQAKDEWKNRFHEGTTIRACLKVLQERDLVGAYYWATTANQVTRLLLTTGCVLVGTAWLEGMMDPDKLGRIRAAGDDCGGHAYVLNGVDLVSRMYRLKNSWGRSWGRRGQAWIPIADFATLLKQDGEACVVLEARD